MMDRNLILAIGLSVLIIVVFQAYFQSTAPPSGKKPPAAKEAVKQDAKDFIDVSQKGKTGGDVSAEGKTVDTAADRAKSMQPSAETRSAEEARIRLVSPKYEALLSSKGGRIVSFKLK
ncbi:MAG: hypothetical protein V2B18_07415, partial [Pseudomonadota bacterium]